MAEFQAGGGIERNFYNFTDPHEEVDGERSSLKAPPHPSDRYIDRQALTLATDREAIVKALYGRGGEVTTNILNDPPQYRSANNKAEFSIERANALLDEAGWKKGASGYREKGGVVLSVLYQTSVNSVQQKTQQIVKDGWERIGVKAELKSIDAGVAFSSDAGNPDTLGKFYSDVQIGHHQRRLRPQNYMRIYHSAYINTKRNQWSRGTTTATRTPPRPAVGRGEDGKLDPEKRAALRPDERHRDPGLRQRPAGPAQERLRANEGAQEHQLHLWDVDYWNIANWVKG